MQIHLWSERACVKVGLILKDSSGGCNENRSEHEADRHRRHVLCCVFWTISINGMPMLKPLLPALPLLVGHHKSNFRQLASHEMLQCRAALRLPSALLSPGGKLPALQYHTWW